MARGKWISGSERLQIAELELLGLSVGDIAERVGRSYWSVYRVVHSLRKRRQETQDEPELRHIKRSKQFQQYDDSPQNAWLESCVGDVLSETLLDSMPMPAMVIQNFSLPLQHLDASIESEIWRLRALCQEDAADPRMLQLLLNFQNQVWLLATSTK